jgi:glycosyltransferase involved in cell wall biosynthesis
VIKKVFIIVPSAVMDSPIKGAVALASALTEWVLVTFITLKQGDDDFDLLNDDIEWVSLAKYKWHKKLKVLRELLNHSGDRNTIATISLCFSADIMNSLCVNNVAITCASVRGNLPITYVNTYGFKGKWLAYFHLKRLKKINQVVSMTSTMSKQVQEYIGKKSPIIGNFINEESLAKYRKRQLNIGVYKFVFTGSLISAKQPLILIDAVATLVENGKDVRLDIFGDGPLMETLKDRVVKLSIDDKVIFHGFVNEPYTYIANADTLVLPSLSEGISRSALEALYLGIPCVLRDVDGNSEFIKEGVNGSLFKDDSELADAMIRVAKFSRDRMDVSSLLPARFRQQTAAKQYLELLECNR